MRRIQGIKRLGPTKYLVTVVRVHPTERRPDGQPLKVKRKRTINGSRREAVKAHEQLAEELERELGIRVAPTRMTLADYAKQWIALRAKRIAHSTLKKYMNDLEKHILPVLGDRLLDELRPSDIRAMFAQDQGAGNSRKNRLSLLSAMAKDALADELIQRDFCLRVSVKVEPVYTDDQPNLLTSGQLAKLLEHFDARWLDALYVLAFTGMRWCEVAGLQWTDIDLDNAELRIRRGNVKGEIGDPKTQASRRTVGLVKPLVERLRARLARMRAECHPGLLKGWVFPRQDGEHFRGYPLRKALTRACKAAGIAIRFTTHGLRRTYNDLARRHVDGLVVRSVVGHSSEAMTEHYSHVDIAEKRAASEAVFNAVKASSKPNDDVKADDVEADEQEVDTSDDAEVKPDKNSGQVTQKVTPDGSASGVDKSET